MKKIGIFPDGHKGETARPAWQIALCYGIAFLTAALPLFLYGQGWTGEVVILLEHLLKNQQDTLHYLASAYMDTESPAGTDPTRILHALPIALALWTPNPARVLDAALLITWVGLGMSVWKLTLLLFPAHRNGAFIAGMITVLTAFDVSQLHVSYYPHLLGVLLFVLALILLIRWWQDGGAPLLALSCAMLSVSMLIYGLAAPSIPFALALLLVLSLVERKPLLPELRRLFLAAAAWGLPLAAYAAVLLVYASFFPEESSSAKALTFSFTLEQVPLWGRMVLLNFVPVAWLYPHPFFWGQTMAYSGWVVAATAAGAAMLAILAAVVMDGGARETSPRPIVSRRFLLLGAALIVMIVASNISFSNLMHAGMMFRTHLVSQVPAAVLLGVALSALWDRERFRRAGIALTTLVFFCGAWSVAERSRHLVSTWQSHHLELASLAEELTHIPDTADIVLFDPPGVPYIATVASWHARGWTGILRGEVQPRDHFFLWSPDREANCIPQGEKLLCSGESQSRIEFAAKNLVILGYDLNDGKYHVMKKGRLFNAEGYRPGKLMANYTRPLPEFAQKIIEGQ